MLRTRLVTAAVLVPLILAIVLLGEQRELTTRFYLGVAIILAAVLLYPLIASPRRLQPETLGTAEAKGISG